MMRKRVNYRLVGGITLLIITSTYSIVVPFVEGQNIQDFSTKQGPFVDSVTFAWYPSTRDLVRALDLNEIDIIGEYVGPEYLPAWETDTEITDSPINGYGYLSINCDRYPLNITSFRRALAFALDKWSIAGDIYDGLAYPLDTVIPLCNPLSIEGTLPYSYYEPELSEANRLLDDAGFLDIDDDGWREAPDGSDFDIMVDPFLGDPVLNRTVFYVIDALHSLGIDARYDNHEDEYHYHYWGLHWWWRRFLWYGQYEIIVMSNRFVNFDVDWLAYDFWSEYADEPHLNVHHFRNATFDSWREQLLHGKTSDEVEQAAVEMQKIIAYECPVIPCYEEFNLTFYRDDNFQGYVRDMNYGLPSWWISYRAYQGEERSFGGVYRWGLSETIDTFNFMVTESRTTSKILDHLYDSLLRRGPDGRDIFWLAENYTIEYHDDNQNVPDGKTRITFDLIQNATWSDGEPLTAWDVVYSINYYRDAPGLHLGSYLIGLSAAYTLTGGEVIVEFNGESFWHLRNVCYVPIIPKHIFVDIGPDGWSTWDPDPLSESFVTSGPFRISAYYPGENLVMTANPVYFYRPQRPVPVNTTTTEPEWNSILILISSTVTTASATIVIGLMILFFPKATKQGNG